MAKKSAHPTYSNPSIVEAMCEVHFRLPDGVDWRPSLPGDLFKEIQMEFPEMEPVPQFGLQMEVGPEGLGHRVTQGLTRFRYKRPDRPILIQLAENIVTLNVLPVYPGWETMIKDIVTTCENAFSVVKPTAVSRIGLRYINKVPKEAHDQKPGEWFKATDYIPTGALNSCPGMLSRLEVAMDAENRLIVTFGDQPASEEGSFGDFILDIDRISRRECPVDPNMVAQEADRLHEDVWKVFAATKTEKIENFLRRQP